MFKQLIIFNLLIFILLTNICLGHNHWWWMPEYKELVQFVKDSSGVTTTFPTSQGDDETKISIVIPRMIILCLVSLGTFLLQ